MKRTVPSINLALKRRDTEQMKALLSPEGFDGQMLGEHCGFSSQLHKRVTRSILNGLLSTFRSKVLLLALYSLVHSGHLL